MDTKKIRNILEKVSESMHQLLDIDRFYAALYDPAKTKLEFPFVKDKGIDIHFNSRPYENVLLPDFVIKKKIPLILEYKLKEELEKNGAKYWPGPHLPLSWMGVPMISEKRVIGVLVVENNRKARAFSDRGVRLLSTVARQTTAAIVNVRLHKRLDRKIAALQAVKTSGIRLGEQKILELIYKQATRLMDTDNMYIALYEPDPSEPDTENIIHGTIRFGLMFVDGKPEKVEPRKAEHGQYGRTEEIIRTREPIFIATRTESEEWYKQPDRQEFIGQTFASWVGVPMVTVEKVLGVIATYHKTQDYIYEEDDLLVLSMLGSQAAVAIENARLYQTAEKQKQTVESKLDTTEKQKKALTELLSLNDLAGRFVHKVSNMAGTIPITVEYIKDKLKEQSFDNETVSQDLEEIKTQTVELLGMAGRIQKSTQKLKHSGNSIIFQKIDVTEVLEKALIQTRGVDKTPRWEHCKVIKNFNVSPLYIKTFESLFTEALVNLISNALDAMPKGGTLTIGTEQRQIKELNYAVVTIADTGKGIPAQDIERIYDMDYSKKSGGFGYGLWLVKRMCDATDTQIHIKSKEGEGTTFSLFVPLIEEG